MFDCSYGSASKTTEGTVLDTLAAFQWLAIEGPATRVDYIFLVAHLAGRSRPKPLRIRFEAFSAGLVVRPSLLWMLDRINIRGSSAVVARYPTFLSSDSKCSLPVVVIHSPDELFLTETRVAAFTRPPQRRSGFSN